MKTKAQRKTATDTVVANVRAGVLAEIEKEMDKRESNGLYEYSASSVDIPEWCHAGLVTDGYTVVTDENGVVTVSWA